MRFKPLLIAALAAAFALPALAQAPQGTPTNVRGKIAKVSGQTLTVKMAGGALAVINLAPTTTVKALQRKKLSDIKDGDYIASTSMPGKDGKLHAIEIHWLPAAAPELQVPYDLRMGSIMTNAHIQGMAKVKDGTDLAVTYKGSTADIVVGPKTVIVAPVDATVSDMKVGKAVFVRAIKAADGTLSANNVTVEKNGVKPPM